MKNICIFSYEWTRLIRPGQQLVQNTIVLYTTSMKSVIFLVSFTHFVSNAMVFKDTFVRSPVDPLVVITFDLCW